ncbi:MAG: DHA2 family efflux MFS transporter permease subunit [Syntrophorhabdales bacterium]|jgi:EmrB/QacA subfamily drug resistance transporter
MRRYLIFVTASLSLLMSAIDSTAVAVAFPNFTRELHTNVLWSAWTLSIFFIAVTMAMPLAGNLGDSFGRKKVFVVSLVLFTGSSLACGLAPTIYALIAFRFLQGIGGACFLPTASGIVADHFPENREAAIGLFSSIFSVGAVIGPNLGGWIVSQYSWRYIFYINVPIGMLLMGSSMLLLKDSKIFSRPRIDLVGVLLMSGSLLFLMFGLNFVGESFSTPSILLTALFVFVSLFLAVCFLRQEKRAAQPILDTALLQSTPFVAANVSNLIVGMTMIGVFSFIPLYATSVHKLSTLMSGVILTPRSLGMAIAAAVTSFFLRRWGYRWPMVFGFGLISLSTMLLAPGLSAWGIWGGRWGTMEMLSLLLLLNGIAGGVVFPAANNACIELMPEKVGTIVGLRNMFRNVGAALGVSLITFILHVNSDPANGFTIVFISFGLTFLVSIPLLFLMPAGRKAWG